MQKTIIAAIILTAVWINAARTEETKEFPSVILPVTESAPVLDGVLDDQCWSKAATLTEFHGLGKTREDMPTATRVMMIRDGAWAYMGFVCSNAMMKHVAQQVFDHDGPVNMEDDVEMFFDPGTGGELWYHYSLSWVNVQKEQRITKKGDRELGWNVPWHSATVRNDQGWTAEVAIPLFVLTSHGNMAKVRMNVLRSRNTVLLDIMKTPSGMERDFGSWSPLENAHDSLCYGYLKGLDGVKVDMPLLPSIEWAEAGGYEKDGANQVYRVKAGIRTHTLTGGKINLIIKDEPKSGEVGKTKVSVEMEGMTSAVVTATVAVASMVQRNITVELEGAKAGEIAQRYAIQDTSMLTLMGQPLVDRNYYTDEESVRVRCEFGMPAEALKDMKFAVKDKDGKELAVAKDVKPRTTVEVPLKGFNIGRHTLNVALSDAEGKTLAEERVDFIKREKNPGCEVKVDKFKRILLKNGTPFFAFGLVSDIDSSFEYYFKAMAEAGWNSITRCYNIRPSAPWRQELSGKEVADILAYLEMAKKYNLMVMDWASNVKYSPTGFFYPTNALKDIEAIKTNFQAQLPDIKQVTGIQKNHPNYLLYMNVDEPSDSEACNAAAGLYYGVKSELDPYHPSFLNYARDIPPEEKWLKYCEVFGYDWYMCPGWGTIYSVPDYTALMTLAVKKRADADGKVMWMVIGAEALDPWRGPRIKSPAEQQCETYLTLIHGTKGLMYFVHTSLFSQNMWNKLGALAREVKEMAPALLEEAVPQKITYQPVAFDLQAQKLPDVQAALFRYPDGKYLLVAANSQWYPVETKFKIEGLKDGKKVKALFGGKNLDIKDSAFGEKIERYGTRAYLFEMQNEECRMKNENPDKQSKIENSSTETSSAKADRKPVLRSLGEGGSEIIEITVTAKACPDEGEPIKLLKPQIEAISKRKNVMPNPSFENLNVSGIPDFLQPYAYLAYPLVNQPDSAWGVDTDNPYRGKLSLRMRREERNCRGMMGGFYPPMLNNASPYVFSVYMHGKKNDDRAWIRVLGKDTTFTLTTGWKRYEVAGTCGPTSLSNRAGVQEYFIGPASTGSEIWVDAMQVEAGTIATPFGEE